MKRKIAACLAVLFVLTALVSAHAYEQRTETLHYRGISILLDGAYLTPRDVTGAEVNPFILSGTTYLPLRAVASALGLEVDWEQETQTIYLRSGGEKQTAAGHANTAAAYTAKATLRYPGIRIILDGRVLVPRDVNGTAVDPFVIDGTTYLPIRAVASALGLEVDWDDATLTVLLTSGAKPAGTVTLQVTPDHGYYYSQLTQTQKLIYDRIVAAGRRYETRVPTGSISRDDAFAATFSACFDHPELYWIHDYTLYFLGDDVTEIEYPVPANVQETVRKLEARAAEILSGTAGASNYETILYIYRWIIDNTDYGTTREGQDVTSVLIRSASACAGYSRTFQYLCHKAGIDCGYAEGETADGTSHSWNFVKLGGQYYWVDTTWGDPVYAESEDNGQINYNYFCVPDGVLFEDHIPYTRFITKGYTSPANTFTLPRCTDDSYNYYKQQGSYFSAYSREAMSAYFKARFAAGQYVNIDLKFADAASYEAALKDLLVGGSAYLFDIVRAAHPSFTGGISYRYRYVEEAHYISVTVTLK